MDLKYDLGYGFRSTGFYPNLIKNPHFELPFIAGLSENWIVGGTATPTEEAGRNAGSKGQGVTGSDSGANIVGQGIMLESGVTYKFSGWIKIEDGTGAAILRLVNNILGGNVNIGTTTSNDWTYIETEQVAIADGITQFRLYSTGDISGTVVMDDVSCRRVS